MGGLYVRLKLTEKDIHMKKNINSHIPLIWIVVTLALASAVCAIEAPLTPQKLLERATHVVMGKAKAIYTRTEQKGDWKYTYYIVEIGVNNSEKGEGIHRNHSIYARYWHRTWIGNGQIPPSMMGHRGRPSEGDALRVYLEPDTKNKNKGIFKVVGPNGFEKLKDVE